MTATPAPHTPIAFLQGGAAGMFSERCKDALAKSGLSPDDFGSYDHVQNRIDAAKAKVNLYDDVQRGGPPAHCSDAERARRQAAIDDFRADNPPPARPPKPTGMDRERAGSQSGHLVMNSAYQRERGNPCTSVVDGYEDGLAPCMLHQDSTAVYGREHHWVYNYECQQPRARGLTPDTRPGGWSGERDPAVGQAPPAPGSTYSADALASDEAWRIQNSPWIDSGTADADAEDAPGSGASGHGADPTTDGTSGPGGPGGPAAAATGSEEDTPAWQKEIDGETAADCIVAFKEAAMAAMKQHCKDQQASNEAAASGNTDMSPEDYRASQQAVVDDPNSTERQRARARRAISASERAECRAQMGARIGTPAEHRDGRCPPRGSAAAPETTFPDGIPSNVPGPSAYPPFVP